VLEPVDTLNRFCGVFVSALVSDQGLWKKNAFKDPSKPAPAWISGWVVAGGGFGQRARNCRWS